MARSVVTGGFGFVGSHVVERLLRAGDEVTVLDSAPCPDDLEAGSGTLRVVCGDVREEGAVAAAVKGGADVIYHLAALVGVDRYLQQPLDVIDVNVLGTRAVLAAAAAGDVKVVVASTSEVYGKNPQVPWAEDTDRVLGSTAADRWCYASSKALAEHMTHAFARQAGLRMCILRYFNVYGPRQRPAYVLSRTIYRLLCQLPPQVFDGGRQTRCFTYVADAAEATVLAGVSDAAVGQCFNIGSDQEISVADAVALAARTVGAGPAPVPLDTRSTLGEGYEDIPRRVPDVGHVERTLGWRARTSLEEGLRLTAEWARRGSWSDLASAGHPVLASDPRPAGGAADPAGQPAGSASHPPDITPGPRTLEERRSTTPCRLEHGPFSAMRALRDARGANLAYESGPRPDELGSSS